MLHGAVVEQVEEALEVIIGRLHDIVGNGVGKFLLQVSAEGEDGRTQQRLDDIVVIGVFLSFLDGQFQHVVEVGVEEYLVIVYGDNVLPLNIGDISPHADFLMEEALEDVVGEEHGLQVEVGTDHQVGDDYVGRDDCHLVLVELQLLAVHLSLHLPFRTDGDGIHRDMGCTDLGKFLDTVHDDNVIVGITNRDVLIGG